MQYRITNSLILSLQARMTNRGLIFFDECECVFSTREKGVAEYTANLQNQLLQEMDGNTPTFLLDDVTLSW